MTFFKDQFRLINYFTAAYSFNGLKKNIKPENLYQITADEVVQLQQKTTDFKSFKVTEKDLEFLKTW